MKPIKAEVVKFNEKVFTFDGSDLTWAIVHIVSRKIHKYMESDKNFMCVYSWRICFIPIVKLKIIDENFII